MTLEETADYLHLAARDVEKLVKDGDIPFERNGSRVVFRRNEIDAWASQRLLEPRRRGLEEFHRKSSARARELSRYRAILPELISEAFIEPALASKTRASVIADMVRLAERTGLLLQPQDLLESLQAREKLCSTAMPGGLALLHPRHHDPYMFETSFIVLGRTVQPVPFGAPDGGLTDLFFLLCCEDDRLHLHTLARVSAICSQGGLLDALRSAAGRAEMFERIVGAEDEVIRHLGA
jgi:PTS system nitrogen regulatory IIA component